MILYKTTAIIVVATIAIDFMTALYYRNRPKAYRRDKANDKFNILSFNGLLILISMILIFASFVRFIVKL